MGDWLVWLLLGSFIVILFCIYSLSSQVERCVHLAVEIITGNQRKIMEQLDALNALAPRQSISPSVVPYDGRLKERRQLQRRQRANGDAVPVERRSSAGRRREDAHRGR